MADHQKEIEEFGNNNDFWLFGYGSLIWKPPPHFDQRVPGYIEGYVRRFWQHSPTERVWGAAYHIPAAHVAEVREYLDIREINGYSIQFTPFHPATDSAPPIKCLVYIGLPSNPQFLGPQDPDALAKKILQSKGPSGENREYLFNLEEALLGLSEESGDGHVSDLVARCREIEREGLGGER
ncbi:hypothetical protein E8E13_004992 [Curvularia kusanoi]|uniref:glutathione-specific gamma-glutamylcyclotransferase n=1 Tax=Curvularia kusanoi TaxID=90978 RepID=A0A9P4TDV1_CURKU|nr:hypothetical protein E8E13_004992 [Curvularia kusanoi]